jgi:hypothetical protein
VSYRMQKRRHDAMCTLGSPFGQTVSVLIWQDKWTSGPLWSMLWGSS